MPLLPLIDLEAFSTEFYDCNFSQKGSAITLHFGELLLYFEQLHFFKAGYPNEEIYMHYAYYHEMRRHVLYELKESDLLAKFGVAGGSSGGIGIRHFIIVFEDEVFECLAETYSSQHRTNDGRVI
jgi:hypothetical protein